MKLLSHSKNRLPYALAGLIAFGLSLATLTLSAQTKSAADGIAEYRAMLADGNPAELFEAKGEDLWGKARGSKNVSLKDVCNLGKGMGVVKGAFVELPRYFADTGKVQDLESRLLTCFEKQGLDAKAIAALPFGRGEQANIDALVAFISGESRGMKFNLPQGHAKERQSYEVGKRVFFARGGPYDFSCASCHSADDQRIRLQDLPNLTKQADAARGFGAWPAYRVSSGELWGMQRRLNDCYRQQRFPYPGYASEVTVALGSYLGVTAKGGESIAPSLKR